jgi:hypothetical protein
MTSESGEGPTPLQAKSDHEATAEEIAEAPEAVNMTDEEEMGAAASKDNSDSGKLKALLNVLRRMVGVKDLAAMCVRRGGGKGPVVYQPLLTESSLVCPLVVYPYLLIYWSPW